MPVGRRTPIGLSAGTAVLLVLYAVAPVAGVRAGIWLVAGLAGSLAVLAATRASRPEEPVAPLLLAAGIALLGIGQALDLTSAASADLTDVTQLLVYPVLAAAVTAFQRDRFRVERSSLLDALVVTVAAAEVGWVVLIEPVLSDSTMSVTGLTTMIGRPLGDLLLIGVVARLLFAVAGSRDTAAHLLGLGLFVGVAGDLVASGLDEPAWTAAWLPAVALVVLAVRHPKMTAPPVETSARLSTAWRFVVLLGLAVLVSPVLVLTNPVGNEVAKAVVVLGGSSLLFVLALVRIVSLLGDLRRAFRREHVLRAATATLVGAADRVAVRDATLDAAVELMDQGAVSCWRIDGDPGGTVATATHDGDLATFLDGAELALLPDSGIEVLHGPSLLHGRLGVPSTQPLALIGLPARGMAREAAVVATTRPPSVRTLASLQSLASTMALALERLDVGEILVERRSERRLRLMLQYASDVICILDHDLTVVHVTPAVEPIVGVPAPELLGLNWLEVVTDDDREAARDLVTLAQGGRPARGEVRLIAEDGHSRHVDAVVTEVIDEDLMGFVITCHDITDRHQLEQQLTHQAFHDSLTGLANRALFRDRLGHAMARARGHGRYGVLFIDLDDFKTVNDGLGHAAGDALLREMTLRLRDCLRDGDTAARLGGDEFAILLEDVDDDEHCVFIAKRILDALRRPFHINATEVTTAASIGIAHGQLGPITPEDLMRNADLALYDAKNAGKNRYAVFATAMHEAAMARLSLTSDLRHAIELNELVVYYQPLVDLESGTITGLEALVRWEHPTHGLMQPGQFITLAEETGLIVPLGRHVLFTALRAAAIWQRAHEEHRGLRIAVNVSGRQLLDQQIVEDVRTALAETGIDPGTVVLEITESVLLPGEPIVLDRLNELADLGVHLYIDDFGTGYSSLSYLQLLPVDGLKLAQEFVDTLPGTDSETGLVRTIRDLAETLGLASVVAEGIESPDQWASLVSLGYRLGQGFHLAVPMPAEKVSGFLSGSSHPGDGEWERGLVAAAEDRAAAESAADAAEPDGSELALPDVPGADVPGAERSDAKLAEHRRRR